METWQVAKQILLQEEAKARSESVMSYGLCKPPAFRPPPPELVHQVVSPLKENLFVTLQKRELNAGIRRDNIPAKETTITSLDTEIRNATAQCVNIPHPKGLSVITEKVNTIYYHTCQTPQSSWQHLRRVQLAVNKSLATYQCNPQVPTPSFAIDPR